MPYYSPISEQAAYCWNQCIRFSLHQFEETLESDMTYVLDVLYSNISTNSAEKFYSTRDWLGILKAFQHNQMMRISSEYVLMTKF
jgi:hypothetical protein